MIIDNLLMGKAIEKLREEKGFTQIQLNKMIGIKNIQDDRIQEIEKGTKTISINCLNKIATALDVPAACLVLLGSKINENDKILTSLLSLLEKTLSIRNRQTE